MEQEKIISEIDKLIAYAEHEFNINQEAFDGINDPYAEGKYLGAKEAYADMAYWLTKLKTTITECNNG